MIDIAALNVARAHSATMTEYYGKSAEKLRQNEAMRAAGLNPIHSESSLRWDAEQAAKHQRIIAALDQVIAYHEGRIYVAGEAA